MQAFATRIVRLSCIGNNEFAEGRALEPPIPLACNSLSVPTSPRIKNWMHNIYGIITLTQIKNIFSQDVIWT
jgi:hypothetical protein